MTLKSKNKFILLGIILIVLGFSLWLKSFNSSLPESLDTLIVLESNSAKVNVLVEDDKIIVEPFEKNSESGNSKSLTITKEKYPELFSKDRGVHFISAEIEGQNLKLINNVHDHGGYSNYYSLTVNLQNGTVLDE